MAHFSSPQWIDMVRGVLSGEARGVMESHLSDGCTECVETHGMWQRFSRFAELEKSAEPPEEAVQVAKSYVVVEEGAGTQSESQSVLEWASSLIPTLVFDSLQEALPAGVRAGAATGRYLLYAANDLMIDLHIQSGAHVGAVLLAGQIANAARPGHPLPDLRVSLTKGKAEVTAYRVNALGEFHSEFQRDQNLALVVTAQGHEPIVIPLDRLFEPQNGSAGQRSKLSGW